MTSIETDFDQIVELLENILGNYKLHNQGKGQISFDCPVCSHEIKGLDEGDGKGNLEINYRIGVYKCWSCGESHETHGNLYKLIKRYGTKKQLQFYELMMPEETEFQQKVTKIATLPKEFISFSSASAGLKMTHYFKQAYNYLLRRNVTDEMIAKYNIGFAHQGLFENRIIIPSYSSDRRLNYFIARSYLPNTKMKYKNPDVPKETIIFNEHLIDWDKPIYLVEGAFDSIFVNNSIAMLGKVMGEFLYSKLYEKAKEIVIVLDGDAWRDAEKLFHKLNTGKLFGKVWAVKMPDEKDIADLKGNFENLEKIQLD